MITQMNGDIIVYGVGHSGTSVVTKMLLALGWKAGSNMDDFHSEDIDVRDINDIIRKQGINDELKVKMRQIIQSYPKPFVIKDPRFIWTIKEWTEIFEELNIHPLLLNIQREPEAIYKTHQRKNEVITLEEIGKRQVLAAEGYHNWPWGKASISYQNVKAASALFDHDLHKKRAAPAKKGFLSGIFK